MPHLRILAGQPLVGRAEQVGQAGAADLHIGGGSSRAQQQVGRYRRGWPAAARSRARLTPGDQNRSRHCGQRRGRRGLTAAARPPAAASPSAVRPGQPRSAASRSSRPGRARPACRTGRRRTPRPARSRPRPGACTARPSPGRSRTVAGPVPSAGTAGCRSPANTSSISVRHLPGQQLGPEQRLPGAAPRSTRRHCGVVSGSHLDPHLVRLRPGALHLGASPPGPRSRSRAPGRGGRSSGPGPAGRSSRTTPAPR